MTTLVGIWSIVVFFVGINLAAGGVAAILHVRRKGQPRRGRVLTAAAIVALLPTALVIPAMLIPASIGGVAPVGMIVAVVLVFAFGFAGSLPGAVIVARQLDKPGDDYRAFE